MISHHYRPTFKKMFVEENVAWFCVAAVEVKKRKKVYGL